MTDYNTNTKTRDFHAFVLAYDVLFKLIGSSVSGHSHNHILRMFQLIILFHQITKIQNLKYQSRYVCLCYSYNTISFSFEMVFNDKIDK